MGVTRVDKDLLEHLKPETDIDFAVVVDPYIGEQGSYNLPYRAHERIDWTVTLEPNVSTHISIKRVEEEVDKFELNEQNLSKTSISSTARYKREITLSLNLQTHQLLLNGKVCAAPHSGPPRGWNCSNYHDQSLFAW
jgi:hypothetical protein